MSENDGDTLSEWSDETHLSEKFNHPNFAAEINLSEASHEDEEDITDENVSIESSCSDIKCFARDIIDEVISRAVYDREYDYDEVPGEDDVEVDDLEAPLGDWISSLLPSHDQLLPDISGEPEEEESNISITEDIPCEVDIRLPDIAISESPMMQKFQTALKRHLLKQKKRLDDDIFNMEIEIKRNANEYKTLGQQIYQEQILIDGQSHNIKKHQEGLKEVQIKLEQYTRADRNSKLEFQKINESYKSATQEEKKTQDHLQYILELVSKMNELKEAQIMEIKSSQSLSDRQKIDKLKSAKDKQKQDMLLWKIGKELTNTNYQTEHIMEEIELKKREAKDLKKSISDIESDAAALAKENRIINAATESLFLEIHNRNVSYSKCIEIVKSMKDKMDELAGHLRSYNKSIHSERKRKIKLVKEFSTWESALDAFVKEGDKLTEKRDFLLLQLAELQDVIMAEEQNFNDLNKESKEVFKEQTQLIRELDQLTLQRLEFEKKYTDALEEKKTQTNTYKNLKRVIEAISHENQDLGLLKLENDCKIGQLMTDIEKKKVERIQIDVKIDNLRHLLKEKEIEHKRVSIIRLKLRDRVIGLKSKVLGAQRVLETLNKMTDDSATEWAVTRKINDTKQLLEEIENKIDQTRMNWTETQNTLLQENNKLSDLEIIVSVLRKQFHVMKHKRHKLEERENELAAGKKSMMRETRSLEHKMSLYSLEAIKVEQDCDRLILKAKEAQLEYIQQLQEGEMDTVNLLNEITELKDDNVDREEEISELQRELLTWEKKWMMAVETKEKIDKEKSSTGEIGAMKIEIHRMEVRLAQLRKIQDKLSADLEMSINLRDSIFEASFSKERRGGKSTVAYSKQQFQKKLCELRSKIKQMQSSSKRALKEIDDLEIQRDKMMEDYINKRNRLAGVREAVDKLEMEIQEGQLHKYKSLELIVRKQRKIKLLEDMKLGKYRLSFKTEDALLNEEDAQNNINSNLIEVVESLLSDFPLLRLPLIQIHNSLTMSTD